MLGTEATERNSTMVDDSDTSMATGRLNETVLQAEQVEKIDGLEIDTRKTDAMADYVEINCESDEI